MNAKKLAAAKAVEQVKTGMAVGLGTGSTVYWVMQQLGLLVKNGLHIKAVATSVQTEKLARELGIPIIDFDQAGPLDICIDGADEADPQHNLIKGGGGALFREKIVAYNSALFIVVVDESKLVPQLGKFPLPIEVLPFGASQTLKHVEALGGKCNIRQANGQPFITDNGNLIADAAFYPIQNPKMLNEQLHQIPGVIETGLFPTGGNRKIIVGAADGTTRYY